MVRSVIIDEESCYKCQNWSEFTHFIVSSRAAGNLCSSLKAGMINEIYFSAGSLI